MSGEPKTHTPEQFQHRYPVEAIQFTGENASQVYKFINYRVKTVSGDDVRSANERGVMRYLTVVPDIHKGDWLVRRPKPLHKRDGYEVNRELVVYSDEDFHATFEPVGVRVVARDDAAELRAVARLSVRLIGWLSSREGTAPEDAREAKEVVRRARAALAATGERP